MIVWPQIIIIGVCLRSYLTHLILHVLQDRGFTQFLRLGSLKRISKAILCHSLHQGGGGGSQRDADSNKDSLAVLKEMLVEASSEQEAATIRWHISPYYGFSTSNLIKV